MPSNTLHHCQLGFQLSSIPDFSKTKLSESYVIYDIYFGCNKPQEHDWLPNGLILILLYFFHIAQIRAEFSVGIFRVFFSYCSDQGSSVSVFSEYLRDYIFGFEVPFNYISSYNFCHDI